MRFSVTFLIYEEIHEHFSWNYFCEVSQFVILIFGYFLDLEHYLHVSYIVELVGSQLFCLSLIDLNLLLEAVDKLGIFLYFLTSLDLEKVFLSEISYDLN